MVAWTTPKTWAVNDILTASDLNTYLRDNENALGKLTSYTPSWTASTTNPAIGNGTLQGRYIALEEWVWFHISLSAGSTTTFGSGTYSLSLPFTASSLLGGTEQNFLCVLNDLGVARYMGVGVVFSSGTTFLVNAPTDWGTPVQRLWTNTVPFTFGNGDTFAASGIYRRV